MFEFYTTKFYRSIATIAVAMLSINSASAAPNGDRVLEKIAALEARIAALETKNREYKRDAEDARARARAASEGPFRSSNAAIPARAVTNYPIERAPRGWTGAFWGASAGGAVTRSSVTSAERYSSAFPSNTPPYTVVGYDMLSSSEGRGAGGFIDLFAGWNAQLSNVVVGVQLEATASDLTFGSAGSKAYTYFDANGPTGQTALGDFRPQVASRWMATAMLRAGILINDQTLLYGLGGWTLGQFEARNVTDNPFFQPVETFLANGWTGGAGIERKLDSNWSVRAEYRYTKFGSVLTNDRYAFQSAGSPFPGTQTNQRQVQYDQSMQAGRIGFAYAFNPHP